MPCHHFVSLAQVAFLCKWYILSKVLDAQYLPASNVEFFSLSVADIVEWMVTCYWQPWAG